MALLKSGIKAAIGIGIIGASALGGSQLNAQEVYTANPFVQPNDTTLNWYGSGDANGDDTLTSADLTRMREVIGIEKFFKD